MCENMLRKVSCLLVNRVTKHLEFDTIRMKYKNKHMSVCVNSDCGCVVELKYTSTHFDSVMVCTRSRTKVHIYSFRFGDDVHT